MGYNNYNRGFEIDEEKTAEFLETAVEKITTEEDIDTLVELAKLFKKYVPLTRRKYVIAYMLKESLKHFHSLEEVDVTQVTLILETTATLKMIIRITTINQNIRLQKIQQQKL